MKTIGVPNGKVVTLGQFVAAWKQLKTLDPNQEVKGWTWYPMPARDVLRAIGRGVQDRVNQRGRLVLRSHNDTRVLRQLRRRIRHTCRWCGHDLGRYAPEHDRFCEPSCKRSFYG